MSKRGRFVMPVRERAQSAAYELEVVGEVTVTGNVLSQAALNLTLLTISFERSCVDMGWEWETAKAARYSVSNNPAEDFLLRCSFRRPDRETGEPGRGWGRWWHVEHGASTSSVVKTAWLAVKQVVEHELMEAFKVSGRRPFDPHRTVDELVGLAEIPR